MSILLWKCKLRNAWEQRKARLYMGVGCHRYPVHTGTATHLKAKICLAACCLPSQMWRVSFAMCSQVWCSLCQSPPSLSARYCCMYSPSANSASQNPFKATCIGMITLTFPWGCDGKQHLTDALQISCMLVHGLVCCSIYGQGPCLPYFGDAVETFLPCQTCCLRLMCAKMRQSRHQAKRDVMQ